MSSTRDPHGPRPVQARVAMSEKALDGKVLCEVIAKLQELKLVDDDTRAAKKKVFAYGKKYGLNPKAIRRLFRFLEDPDKFQRDDEEFETYHRLFESSSRPSGPCASQSSDTKDLGDAAPPDQPPTEG